MGTEEVRDDMEEGQVVRRHRPSPSPMILGRMCGPTAADSRNTMRRLLFIPR